MKENKDTIAYANKKKYISNYNREQYFKVSLCFRHNGEEDIIEELRKKPSKSNYIRNLVIKEIRNK